MSSTTATARISEFERFLFDLQGYLVIPAALTMAQTRELDRLMDERWAEADVAPNGKYFHFRGLLGWGRGYRDLIDHPRVLPYLEEFLGEGFRLDHEYAVAIRNRGGGPSLHGIGAGHRDASQYYHCHDKRIHSGLLVVAYFLRDVGPEEGGFAAVPGSHKANFALPEEWRDLEQPQPFVQRVSGPAGTAVIFTEALYHGTLPWRGAGERRTVFYKYSPREVAFYAEHHHPDEFPELSDRQRAILEPPHSPYLDDYIKRRRRQSPATPTAPRSASSR